MTTPVHFVQRKSLYIYKWTEGGPAGVLYGVSESGQMDTSVFLSWFQNLFLRAVGHLIKTAPVLLSLGGHNSHISFDVIRNVCDSNAILLCLQPNTTHLL